MSKMLLHCCCGPCTISPLQDLRAKRKQVDGLFYNPNIHPVAEHQKRRETFNMFAYEHDFHVMVFDDCLPSLWEAYIKDDPKKCMMCYRMRFEKTAQIAKHNGYDCFSSTLFVSPYQNHEAMVEAGRTLQKEYGIRFDYYDWRPVFRKGQQEAKKKGYYRQRYCGCFHSNTKVNRNE